jgi:glutathione S-transferase
MRLIGMLDSPYVRRVAISLQLLGLRFEHRAVSVFRAFAQFHAINPVVKAPTLQCDDGTVLTQAGVTAAITWHFIQRMVPQVAPAAQFPALAAFKAAPHGDGICVPVFDGI